MPATTSRAQEGTGYRLPTDAEWEFACRAGTLTPYWSGDNDKDLGAAAWFGTESAGRTHHVGKLKSNPFGLFDVHGNVSEWVEDGFDPAYDEQHGVKKTAIDPNGLVTAGSPRVIRGGSWNKGASDCRSAHRDEAAPTSRNNETGFRIVLAVAMVKDALDRNPASASSLAHAGRRGSALVPHGRPSLLSTPLRRDRRSKPGRGTSDYHSNTPTLSA